MITYKKVEGENIVVEIITTEQISPITKEKKTITRAIAYTEEQIDAQIKSSQTVVDKWQTMKDLL